MSDGEAPRAIVGGHGDFADGMLSAVRQIVGSDERFVPLSNRGLSADGIEERIRELLDTQGLRVILTDLMGGSVSIAAQRVVRSREDVVLLTGVSLPVLLQFATHEGPVGKAELEHWADRARQSMRVAGGTARAD